MVRAQGVAFAWDTSFRTSGDTHAVANWSFEVACATYNLAAATSAVALNQSLKEAFQSYQRAAGALETLAELSRRSAWVCEDMSGDTLSVLQALMLAQAQKCLYLQGHKMQPTTLEITAGQCAENYAEVVSRWHQQRGRRPRPRPCPHPYPHPSHPQPQPSPSTLTHTHTLILIFNPTLTLTLIFTLTLTLTRILSLTQVVSRLRDRRGRPFCHLSPQWCATIVANEMLYTGLMHFHASTSLGATHQYGAWIARLGATNGC